MGIRISCDFRYLEDSYVVRHDEEKKQNKYITMVEEMSTDSEESMERKRY